jgi:hypothetical protein
MPLDFLASRYFHCLTKTIPNALSAFYEKNFNRMLSALIFGFCLLPFAFCSIGRLSLRLGNGLPAFINDKFSSNNKEREYDS